MLFDASGAPGQEPVADKAGAGPPRPAAQRPYDMPPRLIRDWSTPYTIPKHGPKSPPDDNVVLEILIDTRGRVAHARIVKSIPFYDDIAIATVKAWIFSPALKGGKPVAVRQMTSVHFGKVIDRERVLLWDEFVAPSPSPPEPVEAPASPAAQAASEPGAPRLRVELLGLDAQGADFAVWLEKLSADVARNWRGPRPSEGSTSDGQFEVVVERDGSVSTARIAKRSGSADFDRAGLKALFGGPLPPLPDLYPAKRARMLIRIRSQVEP
jgi:TonB family protein